MKPETFAVCFIYLKKYDKSVAVNINLHNLNVVDGSTK